MIASIVNLVRGIRLCDAVAFFCTGLSNLGMGYVFEELIRKFNEENNEEAGEHFTPREVINLMTRRFWILAFR